MYTHPERCLIQIQATVQQFEITGVRTAVFKVANSLCYNIRIFNEP